jgi:hypothetical protein
MVRLAELLLIDEMFAERIAVPFPTEEPSIKNSSVVAEGLATSIVRAR